VDNANTWDTVYDDIHIWIGERLYGKNWMFVTDGDKDLENNMLKQME